MRLRELISETGNKNDHTHGTYAAFKMKKESADALYDWCTERNIPCKAPAKLHCTLVYSTKAVQELAQYNNASVSATATVDEWRILGDSLVLELNFPKAHQMHKKFLAAGAVSNFDEYIAHTTVDDDTTVDVLPEDIPNFALHYDRIKVKGVDAPSVSETASSGSTSAGAVASVSSTVGGVIKRGSYGGPIAPQVYNKDGTVKNGLDMDTNFFGTKKPSKKKKR